MVAYFPICIMGFRFCLECGETPFPNSNPKSTLACRHPSTDSMPNVLSGHSFESWVPSTKSAFPDARAIVCAVTNACGMYWSFGAPLGVHCSINAHSLPSGRIPLERHFPTHVKPQQIRKLHSLADILPPSRCRTFRQGNARSLLQNQP